MWSKSKFSKLYNFDLMYTNDMFTKNITKTRKNINLLVITVFDILIHFFALDNIPFEWFSVQPAPLSPPRIIAFAAKYSKVNHN